MSVATIQTSFTTGEVAPSLFGHVDLARFHVGASTMRNMYVGYRGGAYSRAGTKFVGYSMQTTRAYPPRLIPFQFSINQGIVLEFGHLYMRVISNGAFVVDSSGTITAATNTAPCVITVPGAPFNSGDWIEIDNISGMYQLNGRTFKVTYIGGNQYQLYEPDALAVDARNYGVFTAPGIGMRIYTIPTIYGEADLRYLKYTESADVLTLTCVNTVTRTEYRPQDLTRLSNVNWVFSDVVNQASVAPPTGTQAVATATGTVFYQYVVTSVSPVDGSESQASVIGSANNSVNIAATAGTITITWNGVPNVTQYNVYKATPGYGVAIPVGSLFGYAGRAYGSQFIDSNIIPDFTQVPPLHLDPFQRGRVLGGTITNGGSGYTTALTLSVVSGTGSGAVLVGVAVGGALSAIIVQDAGHGYLPTDTILVTGSGTGATATLNVGALTGTYPSVVGYFQQRRVYANSLNNPDTYWMSQPGAFKNFDRRIPTIASDSIIGTPWSVQVNGIQWLVSMPGGLVALTGLSAWQLTGVGGSSLNPQPITPSNQQAQPQAYNGCSPTVPPIKIDFQIIYVQAKGSIYRDLSYNFFTNIYTGEDLTQNSSHLFNGHTIINHAWCEEPYKVLWAVRDDGVMLSLTYNKPQQVAGWARHDTNGLFEDVCSVTEPPVDALYMAVHRFGGVNGPRDLRLIERMDNRIWNGIEDSWCVDCALQMNQPKPNATLTVDHPQGVGTLTGVTNLIGGSGYSTSTTASIVDDNGQGPGTGATVALTIVAGKITAVTFPQQGLGYVNPALVITDPTNSGSGASATVVLNTSAFFIASAAVFNAGHVGSVIRMGGGIATVFQYIDPQTVQATITSPVIQLIPNSGGRAVPQAAGSWSITAPTALLNGLSHLMNMYVTGIADGQVIPPTLVPPSGVIGLPFQATSATVGLAFQPQLQSLYLDVGQPTIQGQRKKISAVVARVEASAGMKVGSNQVDGSVLSPAQIATTWQQMTDVVITPHVAKQPYNSPAKPLYTGDVRIPVSGGYQMPGQVAIQQDQPLPMNVLAFISEVLAGDSPETQVSAKQPRQQQGQGGQR